MEREELEKLGATETEIDLIERKKTKTWTAKEALEKIRSAYYRPGITSIKKPA